VTDARAEAVWGVLPVKAFARGKSRLGGVLSDPVRTAFARSLFEHVARVLDQAPRVRGVVVVSDDQEVRERAQAFGFVAIGDPKEPGLANVVDHGVAEASARGASAVFVCMADLPRLQVAEIEQVIDALSEHAVIVVPDLVEAGTNLLCMAPPGVFASCFGRSDSFARHVARAREHGFAPRELRLPGLCFDVDGPEDLERIA
jgi:2-phospho-L-lactate guanylyltransferase